MSQQTTPEPGRFRRLIGLKRVLIANVAVFAVIAWGFSGEFLRNRDMRLEIERLQGETTDLETKNAELEDQSGRSSSRGVLEAEARTKLNLRKPGEEVVVVRPGPGHDGQEPTPARTEDKDGPRSNPARWWHYFFR